MRFTGYRFGSIEIDGTTFDRDVVIDGGAIRTRRKAPSKPYRTAYGHTPLSLDEDLPWGCRRLVIGTGAAGSLPVMEEVGDEARRRGIELVTVPTSEAIRILERGMDETNAVLHLTC